MNIKVLQDIIKEFILEEDGIGTVEIILIIVIIIGLVIIFRDRMTTLVQNIFSSINTKTNSIIR